jgi:hypothetical protein
MQQDHVEFGFEHLLITHPSYNTSTRLPSTLRGNRTLAVQAHPGDRAAKRYGAGSVATFKGTLKALLYAYRLAAFCRAAWALNSGVYGGVARD